MNSFFRVLKSAFLGFYRNGWLSVAGILVMVLTLFTISTFVILNLVLTTGIEIIREKIDISVYFKDNINPEEVIGLQNHLASMPEVKSVKYVSKEEAMETYKETYKENKQILEEVFGEENPLPASLGIKIADPDKMDKIAETLEEKKYEPIIHNISYKKNKDVVQKLLRATIFIEKIGWGIAAVFIVISLIIIFNTVRITIFSRKDEIQIMKLVGATTWYIRGPFIVEGILHGIIATFISMVALYVILYFSAPAVNRFFGDDIGNVFTFLNQNLGIIISIQIAFGVTIGVISSLFAIRKHLRLA